jgi:hypothetical protein
VHGRVIVAALTRVGLVYATTNALVFLPAGNLPRG